MKPLLIGMVLLLSTCAHMAPAAADEPVTEQNCYSLADATKAVEDAGGKLLAIQDVPGDAADQLMVMVLHDLVQIAPAYHGCMVSRPIALFEAKKPDRPV